MSRTIILSALLILTNVAFGQQVIDSETSGEFITYNDNGSKKAIYNLKKGIADGTVSFFYDNGKLKEKGVFKEGDRNGQWLKWNETGEKLISEAYYKNGKKDSTWKIWDDKGTLRYQMEYKEGKKVGTWKQFDENGKEVSTKKY